MRQGSDDEGGTDGHRGHRGSRHSERGGGPTNRRDAGELQQAVERFERAVQELVGSATSEFSDRATAFLDEATARIEREFGGSRNPGDSERARSAHARRRARSERVLERSPRLCRDRENAKIAGVCAGIANYYGVETWVVRCIAVTGLLFFGSIVFPAYWIMYFVMDNPKTGKPDWQVGSRHRRSSGEDARAPAGPRAENPVRNLRSVQADLQEVELRLRRMETHVTSNRYELQRELHKMEKDARPAGTAGG